VKTWYTLLKFKDQKHRITKKLTPNHRTIKHIYSSHPLSTDTKNHFPGVTFTHIISIIVKHTERKLYSFKISKQVSEPMSEMAGILELSDQEFLKIMNNMLKTRKKATDKENC
jgi:hypothetical protein